MKSTTTTTTTVQQYQNFVIDRILPEKLRAAACRTYFLNIVHVSSTGFQLIQICLIQ